MKFLFLGAYCLHFFFNPFEHTLWHDTSSLVDDNVIKGHVELNNVSTLSSIVFRYWSLFLNVFCFH
jgi:hypothetical protein